MLLRVYLMLIKPNVTIHIIIPKINFKISNSKLVIEIKSIKVEILPIMLPKIILLIVTFLPNNTLTLINKIESSTIFKSITKSI